MASIYAVAKKAGVSTATVSRALSQPDVVVMHGDFSIESGAVAAERLLGREEAPTAIFCFNDETAGQGSSAGVSDAAAHARGTVEHSAASTRLTTVRAYRHALRRSTRLPGSGHSRARRDGSRLVV